MSEMRVDDASLKIHPPILLLIHIFAAFLLNWLIPLPFVFPEVLVWAGYLLILVAIGLGLSAAGRLMKAHTTLDPHGSVTDIVTGGPHQFSRKSSLPGFCLSTDRFSVHIHNLLGFDLESGVDDISISARH